MLFLSLFHNSSSMPFAPLWPSNSQLREPSLFNENQFRQPLYGMFKWEQPNATTYWTNEIWWRVYWYTTLSNIYPWIVELYHYKSAFCQTEQNNWIIDFEFKEWIFLFLYTHIMIHVPTGFIILYIFPVSIGLNTYRVCIFFLFCFAIGLD